MRISRNHRKCNRSRLAKDKIDCLRICGTIHDIGKVAIPAQILSKPGPLSPEEYSLVKTHSKTGHTILEKIDFPWPIADIVCQHHERLDGSGYPYKLTDKNILIEAKILAVADVFEAMTVSRPYRESLGIQGAVDELQENRGTLYDSDVVDSLISLISNHKEFFVKRKRESLAPVVQAIMNH
jgi:HD-GYP domain-containing protein (c-di-GMP phosphodiesterase class II)